MSVASEDKKVMPATLGEGPLPARGSGPKSAWRVRFASVASRPMHVFVLSTVVYLATYAGHFTSGDGYYKRAWAESLVFRHSSEVQPSDPGGYHQSLYGIGHTLLAIPPITAGWLVNRLTGIHATPIFYTLLFVLNGALLMALLCEYLRHDYAGGAVGKVLLLVGLGSIWWPYTKLDFSEPLVTTFFFAGFLLARRGRTVLGFAVAGFACTIREDSMVIVGLLALWELLRTRDLKRLVPMGAGVVPWLALNAVANYVRFGSLRNRGYDGATFSNPLLIGLYGSLLSAGKSVFLFSPPLVLGCLAWRRFRDRPAFRADAMLFIAVFAAQVLLYARWVDWSGDDCWGDRFLIESAVLMTVPAVELVQESWRFGPALAAGLLVQLLAVLPGPLTYVVYLHVRQVERAPQYVKAGVERQRVDIDDMRFNPRFSALAGHWMFVERMFGIRGSRDAHDEAGTGTPLAVAMPLEPDEVAPDILWLQALHGHLHQSRP